MYPTYKEIRAMGYTAQHALTIQKALDKAKVLGLRFSVQSAPRDTYRVGWKSPQGSMYAMILDVVDVTPEFKAALLVNTVVEAVLQRDVDLGKHQIFPDRMGYFSQFALKLLVRGKGFAGKHFAGDVGFTHTSKVAPRVQR